MTAFIITMTNILRVGDTDIHIMCDRYNEDKWNIFISIVVRPFPRLSQGVYSNRS